MIGNLLKYMCAKNCRKRWSSNKAIAKIKWCSFFASHGMKRNTNALIVLQLLLRYCVNGLLLEFLAFTVEIKGHEDCLCDTATLSYAWVLPSRRGRMNSTVNRRTLMYSCEPVLIHESFFDSGLTCRGFAHLRCRQFTVIQRPVVTCQAVLRLTGARHSRCACLLESLDWIFLVKKAK